MYQHALLLKKYRLQKSLLPLLDSVCNNTIHNILLRYLQMLSKFAEQIQLHDIYKNLRIVF